MGVQVSSSKGKFGNGEGSQREPLGAGGVGIQKGMDRRVWKWRVASTWRSLELIHRGPRVCKCSEIIGLCAFLIACTCGANTELPFSLLFLSVFP